MKKLIFLSFLFFSFSLFAGDYSNFLKCFNPDTDKDRKDISRVYFVKGTGNTWFGRVMAYKRGFIFESNEWLAIEKFKGKLGHVKIKGHLLEKGEFILDESSEADFTFRIERPWDYEWDAPSGGLYGYISLGELKRTLLCGFEDENFEYDLKWAGGDFQDFKAGLKELLKYSK